MVKIIETNLSIDNETNKVEDHQSRIIEAESWEKYIDYYYNHMNGVKGTKEFKCLTAAPGHTLLYKMEITNLEHDEIHLTCDTVMNIELIKGKPYKWITKKLAYLIIE